jgi:hypothetical protein
MMTLSNTMRLLGGAVLGLCLGGAAMAADAPSTKPAYPLTTCVVSGEKLGAMGDPVIMMYEGREVRLCCSNCEKEFKADPAKFMKKLDDAAPATQPAR